MLVQTLTDSFARLRAEEAPLEELQALQDAVKQGRPFLSLETLEEELSAFLVHRKQAKLLKDVTDFLQDLSRNIDAVTEENVLQFQKSWDSARACLQSGHHEVATQLGEAVVSLLEWLTVSLTTDRNMDVKAICSLLMQIQEESGPIFM